MKKVVFKCCLSGSVFYKKGDEALLDDSEALRLLEKGIVEIVEQEEEQKQNIDEKSNTDERPQEDQETQEKPQKQNEKEDKKGKK